MKNRKCMLQCENVYYSNLSGMYRCSLHECEIYEDSEICDEFKEDEDE